MASEALSSYFAHQLLRAHDWQHRPQFDEVCKWWRDGGRGVIALVGMGGAGKTAITERFLRVLPGGLPADPDVVKDVSLAAPRSVLIFSFYDAPNPEAFFESLQMWLGDSTEGEKTLSLQQLFFKLQQTSGLLVLDGLEKVQEDGVRGLLGRLASPKLRDLLDRIAAGYFPELRVLVTSRFPLADLRDARPQFFRLLPIDEIELPAGVQLLRARGVRGTDLQLASIVEACGRHALTVEFAGGYIAEFGGGDPATPVDFKMDSAELRQKLDHEPDEARRHVLKQGHRFARVAERYRDAMLGNTTDSEGDAAALALLQRICLFRLGVDAEMLASIFTGEKAIKISGPALAALTRLELQRKLNWLVRIRIVEASVATTSATTENLKPKTVYTIHPAVRDGFLSGIGEDVIQESHEAIRHGLDVSLGDAPGKNKNPSDASVLDLLEEIVHHTLNAGRTADAWHIYKNRLGGCHNIIARLNDYARAIRITEAVHRKTVSHPLPVHETIVVLNDYAYSQLQIGCVSEAQEILSVGFKLCQEQNDANLKILGGNLATAQKLSGHLRPAIETCRVLELNARDPQSQLEAISTLLEIELLRGCTKHTIRESDLRKFNTPRFADFVRDHLPHTIETPLLSRNHCLLGFREKIKALEKDYPDGHYDLASMWLTSADAYVQNAELELAEAFQERARNWAVLHDAKEILCRCELINAHVALSKLHKHSTGANGEESSVPVVSLCSNALRDGLRIARDCGYGIYHIDLLLSRARLHLLSGEPQLALDDINTALDEGVPANEQTGQPELLASTHAECGYAWAIAEGLQLRGEALLLKAAQELQSRMIVDRTMIEVAETNLKNLWQVEQELAHAVKCRQSHEYTHETIASMVSGRREMALTALRQIPYAVAKLVDLTFQEMTVLLSRELNGHNVVHRHPEYLAKLQELQSSIDSVQDWRSLVTLSRATIVERLIFQARNDLESALTRWQPLHAPEPERPEQNFQLDGQPYNYRAAETHRILTDLEGGVLTSYAHVTKQSLAANAAPRMSPGNDREPKEFEIPKMEREESRNSGLILLLLLAQAYYKMLEATISLASWVTALDLELNHSYLWTVQNLTNLLKNHEHLQDFPVKFEPIVPDLYPSTIADLEWQDMIAPEAEGFLAAAQRYVVTKGYYEPEEKSPAWIMVELFRPSIQRAVECAERYHDRMRSEQRKILGVSKKQFQTHAGSSRPAPESHMAMSFHVFLSHNSKDKPAVKQLGTELKERGLNPWLDEWELRPGLGWQDALEDIIKTCQSAAICVAENGIGPWEDPEMKALLRRFVNEKKSGNILPIIPVLLPGAPAKVRLPLFLEEYTWVDLRNGLTKEGLDMLIWGITGKKPGSLPAPQTIAAIEFTLDRPLSEFNEAKFRSAFQQATGIDAKFIRIASIRSGSTIVRIEASPDVLEEAIRQFQSAKGKLHEFSQLTGLTVMRWMIGGTEYELAVETSEAMAAPRVLARLQEEDRERDSVMSGFTLAFVTYQAVGALYDDDHSPHRDLIRTYRARVVSAAASLNLCSGGAPSDEAGRALINWLVATQDVNYNSARDLSVDAMLSIIDNFQKAQSKHVTARTTRKIEMIRCKVLFLAANPLDCDSLELDEEARAIEQRILQTNHRDAIDFVPKFAVRRDDLQFHLNKEQPHVLHFSGHGSKDEIAFKGNDGNAASVSKAGLKAMLKAVKDNIRLVVLNACYTRQQADSITDVIDCAIGMKRDIGDEAAQVFAASFYLAIGFGRSVQNAFDQAVAALQVMGIPEQKTPILSCRDGIDASNVFLVEATEKPANP